MLRAMPPTNCCLYVMRCLMAAISASDCPVCPQQAIPVCGSDGDTYNNECYVKMKNCIEKTEVGIVHCGECTNRTDVQTVGVPVAPQEVHLQSCSNGMNKKLKEEEAVAEIIWAPASGFCVPIINYIVEVLNTSKQNAEWEMLYDDVPGDWYVY
ncbi:PREDICTED: agrin-like [Priapulus caudatus]|uniref:Agrin-like n=1 Tax=Priapulus caudatus TaxID=37621 RepID=A0ABM1F7M8_PRICU|nr:PREDICTED: agrin-like [Priapulus caudatus]